LQVGNGDVGRRARLGAAAAITLALAAGVATESDSRAGSLSVKTPSVSIKTPAAGVEVPSVTVDPSPTPVELPKVTLPPVPVEPPPSPIEPPSLPVSPPSLPIESPTAPGGRSLPSTPALPTVPSPPASPSQPGSPSQPASRSAAGDSSAVTTPLAAAIPGLAGLPSRSALAKLPPAQRRELVRRAFGTPLRKEDLRRLRSAIREHRDCLGTLPVRGRRALELRAGLRGGKPVSRRVVARRIGTSPAEALRLERSSLRRLIGAGERGGCGQGAMAGAFGGPAATGFGGPTGASSDDVAGGGRDPRPAGEVLADVAEGGPGIDLEDGDAGAAETLLFFLLALFALLAPLAAIAIAAQRRAGSAAAAGQASERPLLFLDVDGVIALTSLSNDLPPGQVRESPLGFIYLPDRAGGLVRKLKTRFDIVWATGWEHRANTGLLRPLGLREELPVLTFGKKARYGSSDWKLKRVNAYARDRPAAWLDDNFVDCHERWAAERPEPTLLVPVDSRAGLTEDHVERLLRWADRLAASPEEEAKPNGHRRARAG